MRGAGRYGLPERRTAGTGVTRSPGRLVGHEGSFPKLIGSHGVMSAGEHKGPTPGRQGIVVRSAPHLHFSIGGRDGVSTGERGRAAASRALTVIPRLVTVAGGTSPKD